jgi:RNase adapter protein RapZ
VTESLPEPLESPIVPELTIVTGMSGAGRTTVGDVLEDLGWFVVDNLPPGLIPPLVELGGRTRGEVPRIAAVVDVRGRQFFADLRDAMADLEAAGVRSRLVFLEASDEALIRRFEGSRRRHPLQGSEGRLTDGIDAERRLLSDLRGDADLVIDTSAFNVHQLRAKVEDAFAGDVRPVLRISLVSFGYKYGLPADADLVLDCRFLPNPHWIPDLRPQTGLDPDVRAYVLAAPGATELLDSYQQVLDILGRGYLHEGKRWVTLAVGCTGGKHRSVAMAEELGRRLREDGIEARVVHRDLGRE